MLTGQTEQLFSQRKAGGLGFLTGLCWSLMNSLILGVHAPEGYCSCLSVCVCVCHAGLIRGLALADV